MSCHPQLIYYTRIDAFALPLFPSGMSCCEPRPVAWERFWEANLAFITYLVICELQFCQASKHIHQSLPNQAPRCFLGLQLPINLLFLGKLKSPFFNLCRILYIHGLVNKEYSLPNVRYMDMSLIIFEFASREADMHIHCPKYRRMLRTENIDMFWGASGVRMMLT